MRAAKGHVLQSEASSRICIIVYLNNKDHINIKDDEEEGDRVRTRVCGQVTSVSGGRVEVSVIRNGNGYIYWGAVSRGVNPWPKYL